MRWLLVLVLLAALSLAGVWSRSGPAGAERLTYVTTANQLGVVGYRDPVAVVSLDGSRVAFSEGRRLFESPTFRRRPR